MLPKNKLLKYVCLLVLTANSTFLIAAEVSDGRGRLVVDPPIEAGIPTGNDAVIYSVPPPLPVDATDFDAGSSYMLPLDTEVSEFGSNRYFDAGCTDGIVNGVIPEDVYYFSELYSVKINGLPVSDSVRMLKRPCGALLAELQDFYDWRLFINDQQAVNIDEINYLSLLAYPTLKYEIDDAERVVNITVSPRRFTPTIVDFSAPFKDVDDSALGAFLNYGVSVNYQHQRDNYSTFGNVELGVTSQWGVITTNWIATYINDEVDVNRINSQYRLDFPSIASTLTVGDIQTRGEWAGSYQLGGVIFGNTYQSQPQYSLNALHDITVYTNEAAQIQLESERTSLFNDPNSFLVYDSQADFRAGNYIFTGLPSSSNGEYRLNVLERGGATYIEKAPVFYNQGILRRNINSYSVSMGYARKSFLSEIYQDFVISATNYYGFSNYFTGGLHVDYSDKKWIYGLETVTSVPYIGVITNVYGVGHGEESVTEDHMRYAVRLRNNYSDFSYSASYQYTGQRNLRTVLDDDGTADNLQKHRYSARVSMPIPGLTSRRVNVSYIASRNRDGSFRDRYSTGYSFFIGTGINSSINYQYQVHPNSDWSVFLRYSMDFEAIRRALGIPSNRGRSGGSLFTWDSSRANVSITRSKGSDFNGTLSLTTAANKNDDSYSLSLSRPLFQNGSYRLGGNFSNRYFSSGLSTSINDGEARTTSLRFNSGLVLFDNDLHVSRSVSTSFATVKLGKDNAGVRVNGYAADKNGDVFIPNLGQFNDNKLRISSADLAMTADVEGLQKTVRPGFRSGLIVDFKIDVPAAALLTVMIEQNGRSVPLPLGARVTTDNSNQEIPVGADGLLYVDNITERTVVLVEYRRKKCSFTIELPEKFDRKEIQELGIYQCKGA